ncbi:E3 ubiquitin-protein ligase TRIM21 isoform X2 [Astatotilapia calliptera]|uniref:Bloodthirsty-related gene family, member 1 n=1 Tax=Astatotilapia calliptera TaxID=8154 RepID=A0A3P8Q9E7_ASTCA|nr:E3 ubiquitin-protein ligase TRIM21-like isoform X2 [Astatotilapia calliptera]
MAMSLPAAFLSEEQFTCPICLEVFTKPVTTPCGHSFCQTCISSYWDGNSTKMYQCPLCKESFLKRPALHINLTLKEITEQFKQMAGSPVVDRLGGTEPSRSPSHHNQPLPPRFQRQGEMPENIFAEMMSRFQRPPDPGLPHAALPQSQSRDGAPFVRTEHHDPPPPYPSDSDLPPCPIHLRGLEFFCRTDNVCVCSTCVGTSDHLGHNITPAKREWHLKKAKLGVTEAELKELISERERKVEEVHSSLREIKDSAERETDEAVCAFSKLISSVEHCQAEVLEVIEVTLRAAERRAQSVLRELEEEIAELKRRSSALSQLALSEDYIFFLKTFPSLSAPWQAKNWSGVSVSSQLTSGVILRSVNQMMEQFHKELRILPEICQQSSSNQSLSRPNPKVKRVQEYAVDITLDPTTAHPRLTVSADGKRVYCGDRHQVVPDNPKRFDRVVCLLANQGFNSGRHYWEVEVGGKTDWDLGVANRSINRKGKITVSPAHGYWFLSLRDQSEFAFRTEPSTNLTVHIRPSRVGIYVDYDKGLLSFYNVDAKVLMFTFTDSFSDTIHPFFSPCTNKSGRNEAPLIICPVAMTE